jgi:hypothetical protein
MMVELSIASGRPLAELLELEPEELATVADVVEELGRRRG